MTVTTSNFDTERAALGGKPIFQPLIVERNVQPLQEAKLSNNAQILTAERNGQKIAFLIRQLSYHHLAQGKLAGEPYLVSF
ncbi:MAG: hypothetical protein AAF902_11405 [Chloroflexota bacterium]